jgi:hypothetical protein
MRLPGLAWLELSVERDDDDHTIYHQRAIYHPHGLPGHAYWWSVAPFHGVVFGSMLRNIAEAAERLAQARSLADAADAIATELAERADAA